VREALDHQATFRRNLDALLPLMADNMGDRDLKGLQRFGDAFLSGWREVLWARPHLEQVVDGHGDLRAEHVLLEGDGVRIVDRIEWDSLRRVDIADDLAFLLMDLESHDGAAFTASVLDGYVRGGGLPPPAALLAFFGAYRALVRAKVAALQAAPGAADEDSAKLIGLARRLSWRARGPLVLLVTGPPAAGKSTLARALADVSGLALLSSDDIRTEGLGRAPGYGEAERATVYRRLAEGAQRYAAVIIDATFGDFDLQSAFTTALGTERPLLVVDCLAPRVVRIARADARYKAGGSASEAGPSVADMLGDRFQTIPSGLVNSRRVVDTQTPVDEQVDAVEAWLDARLAQGSDL